MKNEYTVTREEQAERGLITRPQPHVLPARVREPIDVAALAPITPAAIDGIALASLPVNTGQPHPIESALASAIRILSVACGVFTVAWAVGRITDNQALTFSVVAVGIILACVWILRSDNRHSAAGVELAKVKSYESIQLDRTQADKEIRFAQLESFDKMVRLAHGHNDSSDSGR